MWDGATVLSDLAFHARTFSLSELESFVLFWFVLFSFFSREFTKREPYYTVHGNANWCGSYREQFGDSFKKLKIELPYDPAVPLLGMYQEKTMGPTDSSISVFFAALFTITRTRKQPRCPSAEEWIKMAWFMYNGMILSHKKNKIIPFSATWMDLEIVILSEVCQTEKEKYRMISFVCRM